MKEPYRTQFADLIRKGAGTLDIHDSKADTSFTIAIEPDPGLVDREIERVDIHRKSMNAILEKYVGRAERILDVGCSTGGTAVAMALSDVLGAKQVIGLDPNRESLVAAEVRAKGYEVDDRVEFRAIDPGASLQFEDASFDLTICVSVIEYVYSLAERFALLREIERVTKPGGYILIVTPNPLRLKDFHTKRWFGDFRREDGYPWASFSHQLEKMLGRCDIIPLRGHQVRHGLSKMGLPSDWFPDALGALGMALPWQKVLARRRAD